MTGSDGEPERLVGQFGTTVPKPERRPRRDHHGRQMATAKDGDTLFVPSAATFEVEH
ncbi:hypothetical protein ACFYQA_33970 [Streptomyces sp. NPDC005774]|uniref:hypothetical protein n=1 Tax=Streptomyces sp. NPDC005774 TaxID=3364728 RepID=UPI00368A187F